MTVNNKHSRIPLSLVPSKLREDYVGDPPLTYERAYRGALNGRYPAEQHEGRWYVTDDNIPLVGEAYGLSPRVNEAA